MRRVASCRAGLLALALLVPGASSAAEVIGKAAAVRRLVEGTPPGEPTTEVETGDDAFLDERIVTDTTGDAEFVFLDESTLTVGPESELVLDRFVFDPERTDKAFSVRFQRGVARYIGGRISKKGEVEIRTPAADIGIRGGIVSVSVGSDPTGTLAEGTQAILTAGRMSCAAGSQREVVTTPGYTCVAGATLEVRPASRAEIEAMMRAIRGSGPLTRPVSARDPGDLQCGTKARFDDEDCAASSRGLAGVLPEPLGAPRDAEEAADLESDFQEPRSPVSPRGPGC